MTGALVGACGRPEGNTVVSPRSSVGQRRCRSISLCRSALFERSLSAEMEETMKLLRIDPASFTTVESYLDEYFKRILSKLKEVAATSKQTDFYI